MKNTQSCKFVVQSVANLHGCLCNWILLHKHCYCYVFTVYTLHVMFTYISFRFDSSVVCICMFENILNRANGTFEYNQHCVVVVALVASCVLVVEYCKCTPMIKCATKCKIVAAYTFHKNTHTRTAPHTDICWFAKENCAATMSTEQK